MRILILLLFLVSTGFGQIFDSHDAHKVWGRRIDSAVPSDTNILCWDLAANKIKWCSAGSGSGTVTSVSFTGGIVSVANPTTTPAFTVAGTSGGIPYFSSASTWASSAALAQFGIVIGGGAGAAPSTAAGWAISASGQTMTGGASATFDCSGCLSVSLPAVFPRTDTAFTMSAGATITGTSSATVAGLAILGGNTSDVTAGRVHINNAGSVAWANGTARTFLTNVATADRTVFIPDANSDTVPRTATANLIAISSATAAPTWLTPGTGVVTFLGLNSTTVGQVLRVSSSNTYTWGAVDLADSDAITGTIPVGNLPSADLNTGTSKTFSVLAGSYFECTGTCTITMPVPAAGKQYCVRNGNNVATVITFAAIGSSASYEVQAKTSYGTAGTGTFVSAGAVGDQVCFIGKDSTHYDIWSINGTWTAN